MRFRKAQRKQAKLRLALCGPSGSGKTFSSLLIAKGIGGPVAMIDTERGSGELYADNPTLDLEYDVLQLEPPYSPDRYVEAINAAKDAGYNVVIIDSLTHMWSGEGGLLEMVDTAAKSNRGNSFAGWKAVRPYEKAAINALTGTPIHIIATLRVKTGYEMEKDEKTGKTRPVKIGLKPEQREGLEYEFTTVFDLSVDGNVASVSKDRTALFRDRYFVPTVHTGRELLTWLNSGVPKSQQILAYFNGQLGLTQREVEEMVKKPATEWVEGDFAKLKEAAKSLKAKRDEPVGENDNDPPPEQVE